MLILIAGASGTLGQHLITSALNRNHTVRALSRTPSKLSAQLHSRLESFIVPTSYHDIEALDRAVAGVSAIICAYVGLPELQVDAQLLLLRAGERAGVTKFIANAWNYDWRTLSLGQHESYDPYLCFRRQVELTSAVKPVFIFTGVLAEVLFLTVFTTKYNGIWDREGKRLVTYGTGDEVWHVTTYADAAEYTIEFLQLPDIDQGGYFSISSFVYTTRELARAYGEIRGVEVPVVLKGSVDDLRKVALDAREKTGSARRYLEYIGLFYQLFTLDGTWVLKDPLDSDDGRFSGVEKTSLERFLRENSEA